MAIDIGELVDYGNTCNTVQLINTCSTATWRTIHPLRQRSVHGTDEDSLSQPQPGHFYYVLYFMCFSYAVSLIKAIINCCYWQSDWILFHSRNIDISFFG